MSATPIAVVGMSGQFPGAPDLSQFWRNLCAGTESIRRLDDPDIDDAEHKAHRRDPGYVAAHPVLEDIEAFDPAFFRISPKEAASMDPQHRLFLENCAHALEQAACDPARFAGRIGVFATSFINTYLLSSLMAHEGLDPADVTGLIHRLALRLGNEADYLASTVAYKLDLRGPAVAVNSACSSSLVAVHLAVQSLRSGDSDVALAGGVSIRVPQRAGYLFREGEIFSPDGRCRAFDDEAHGTVFGNGVGVVALKRLDDALADGDPIDAVIRGSAINNDGAAKAGYTAPSVRGQVDVIRAALEQAGVDAADVSYVEAHGTGTKIGDPIEVAALTEAFRVDTDACGYCSVGSVKTNVGHLRNAAGIAGFIKTVLMLRNETIVPSLHLRRPNRAIDFPQTPFEVATQIRPWPRGDKLRVAGVSALGVGGTNAHVVVEQAPPRAERPEPALPSPSLIVLSAKTDDALTKMKANLARALNELPDATRLSDVAATLQRGRTAHALRTSIVADDPAEAAALLASEGTPPVEAVDEQPVVFLFPGQGAQFEGMGRQAYARIPEVATHVDRCFEILGDHGCHDLEQVLFGSANPAHELRRTDWAQLATFVTSYAQAAALLDWGITPAAMLGHSIGQYVAATLAGTFSLEQVLPLLITRGALMRAAPTGRMLAVQQSEAECRQWLSDAVSMAAVNAPRQCVLAGDADAIDALATSLRRQKIGCVPLQTSHAFHSHHMHAAAEAFTASVEALELGRAQIPYLDNRTGAWVDASTPAEAGAWGQHLRSTVRFGDCVSRLLDDGLSSFIEIGPGATLCGLVKAQAPAAAVVSTMPRSDEPRSDRTLLAAVGALWGRGATVCWSRMATNAAARRVHLPGYPFARGRYWIEPKPAQAASASPTLVVAPAEPLSHRDVTAAPASDVEAALQASWCELLGMSEVGLDDNFFELGGHSLMVARVFAQLLETYDVEIPHGVIFEKPTIRQLAEYVDDQRLAAPSEAVGEQVTI